MDAFIGPTFDITVKYVPNAVLSAGDKKINALFILLNGTHDLKGALATVTIF